MTQSEKALKLHEEWNGKITTTPKCEVKSREDLAIAYTPGVAEPCKVIAANKEEAYRYTIKSNTVAVVSDGSAVLGLGNIGAEAAMPVMEGKCVLFKEFGDVDAIPLCVRSKDVDEIVQTVRLLAGSFGGVNLEDISAPRCFEIEKKLKECCDIPIFHDDQHGTAVIALAALINSLRLTGKKKEDIKVIGIRHGEKMYETLLTNEECAKAVDMGNFYRVPADNRGLNYDKYFKDGDENRNTLTEFNSNNTEILDVEQTKAKIVALEYIQDELARREK